MISAKAGKFLACFFKMASEVCWKIPVLTVTDARSVSDLRYLPFVGESTKKSFYVKNIPSEWDDWKVFHVFRQFGLVNNVVLPDIKTENVYRYGFVELLSLAGADNVWHKLNGNGILHVDGLDNPLQVQRASSKSKMTTAREVHSHVVQKENLIFRKENEGIMDEVGKMLNRINLGKQIRYSRNELLELRAILKNLPPPILAVEEIRV